MSYGQKNYLVCYAMDIEALRANSVCDYLLRTSDFPLPLMSYGQMECFVCYAMDIEALRAIFVCCYLLLTSDF